MSTELLNNLIKKDLKEFQALLLQDFEYFLFFNPQIHTNNRMMDTYDRLLKLIKSLPNETNQFIAEKQLEITILTAKKKYIEQKQNKTLLDLEQIITILNLINFNYTAIANRCKETEERTSKRFVIFNKKIVKNNDTRYISEQERDIAFYQTKIAEENKKLISHKNQSPDINSSLQQQEQLQREAAISIESYNQKIQRNVDNIVSKYIETGKILTKKIQQKIFTLNPNYELPKKVSFNSLLDDPAISHCFDEIKQSFKWWFNPVRFLSNLEKLHYHIKRITNITSEESYTKLVEILSGFFKQMPTEQLQSFHSKFKGKIFNLLQEYTNQYYHEPSDDLLRTAVFTDLNRSIDSLDYALAEVARQRKIKTDIPDSAREKSKNYAFITESIDEIIKNSQSRPIFHKQEKLRNIVWSQHITASNAAKLFPRIHGRIISFKKQFENFSDIKRINIKIDLSHLYPDRTTKENNILLQAGSDDAISKQLRSISKHPGMQAFLAQELTENSILSESSIAFIDYLTQQQLIPTTTIKQVILTPLHNGDIVCQVVRSITQLNDTSKTQLVNPNNPHLKVPVITTLIDNPSNDDVAVFDTTYIISTAGKNKVKVSMKEHNTYAYHDELKKHMDNFNNTRYKAHTFALA